MPAHLRRLVPAALVPAALAVVALPGCSGLLTADRVIAQAEEQWAALDDDARTALGVGDERSWATGASAQIWVVQAGLDGIDPAATEAPGGTLTAGCLAAVAALQGTGTQAFGFLPVGGDLVVADRDTCTRGLGAAWLGAGDPPSGPFGEYSRGGELELGHATGSGEAELIGVTIDVPARTIQASSDAPAWRAPVAPLDPVQFDADLAAVATSVPAALTVDSGAPTTVVALTPAGSPVQITAVCPDAPSPGRVAVTSTGTEVGSEPLGPGQAGAAAADCPGTATATIAPSMRVTRADGTAVDVTLVRPRGAPAGTPYQVLLD